MSRIKEVRFPGIQIQESILCRLSASLRKTRKKPSNKRGNYVRICRKDFHRWLTPYHWSTGSVARGQSATHAEGPSKRVPLAHLPDRGMEAPGKPRADSSLPSAWWEACVSGPHSGVPWGPGAVAVAAAAGVAAGAAAGCRASAGFCRGWPSGASSSDSSLH